MLQLNIINVQNTMYPYVDIINHKVYTLLTLKRLLSKELENSLSYLNDKQQLHIEIVVINKQEKV